MQSSESIMETDKELAEATMSIPEKVPVEHTECMHEMKMEPEMEPVVLRRSFSIVASKGSLSSASDSSSDSDSSSSSDEDMAWGSGSSSADSDEVDRLLELVDDVKTAGKAAKSADKGVGLPPVLAPLASHWPIQCIREETGEGALSDAELETCASTPCWSKQCSRHASMKELDEKPQAAQNDLDEILARMSQVVEAKPDMKSDEHKSPSHEKLRDVEGEGKATLDEEDTEDFVAPQEDNNDITVIQSVPLTQGILSPRVHTVHASREPIQSKTKIDEVLEDDSDDDFFIPRFHSWAGPGEKSWASRRTCGWWGPSWFLGCFTRDTDEHQELKDRKLEEMLKLWGS